MDLRYKETAILDWFLRNKYTLPINPSIKHLKPPIIDVEKIKDGIQQYSLFNFFLFPPTYTLSRFKKGELNFDDIDESGKYNAVKLHKTFFEAPNMR